MNVNLTPVSDSSKATTSTSQSSETEQSEGFFSKLAAFLKGESGDKPETKKVTTDSSSVGDESTKLMLEQQVNLDEDAIGEELATVSKSAESDKAIDVEASGSANKESSNKAEIPIEAVLPQSESAISANGFDSDAEKIVSENSELLERIDGANRALQSSHGKELPPEVQLAQAPSDSAHMVTPKLHNQAQLRQTIAKDNVVADINIATDVIGNVEKIQPREAPIGPSQKLMNDIPEKLIESEPLSSNLPLNPEVNQYGHLGVEQVARANLGEIENAKLVNSTDIEQLKLQLKAQGVTDQEIEQIVEFAKAQALSEPLPSHVSPLAKAVNSELRKQPASQQNLDITNQDFANSRVDGQGSAAAGLEAAPTMMASAIPWSSSVEETELSVSEVPQKVEVKHKAQHAQWSQSVSPQLNQTSATINGQQLVQASASTPFSNEFSVNQLQHVAATPVASEQVMLKTAMGAKAVESLGKLSQTGSKSEASRASEPSLVQQLAQASGQQAGTGQTQLRAEQMVAQAPMPLNREMAGDQVAERVQMMMSKNLKNVDIRLDPPELGRLQIRLNMGGDGATVHFTVANQQARDVIEQSMPRLREMLAQQGVQLGDSSVQQQSSGQQNRYAGNGPDSGQGSSNQAFAGDENLEPDVNLDLNVITKRDGISYYA